MRNPFRYFNSSPEVIRLVVMMAAPGQPADAPGAVPDAGHGLSRARDLFTRMAGRQPRRRVANGDGHHVQDYRRASHPASSAVGGAKRSEHMHAESLSRAPGNRWRIDTRF